MRERNRRDYPAWPPTPRGWRSPAIVRVADKMGRNGRRTGLGTKLADAKPTHLFGSTRHRRLDEWIGNETLEVPRSSHADHRPPRLL
jgi:hypothetical protein